MLSSGSTIVHQYRYFYYLANELAYLALIDKHKNNAYRYAVGTVIMSYTTIETYFNHVLFSDEYPIHSIHEGMSGELKGKVERMSLPEKIEFTMRFYPGAQPEFLKTNQEPYQSFDLLRQMRNLLIHYVPERELVWSVNGEHIDNIKKIERRLKGKFDFISPDQIQPGDLTKAFLYRIFNKHCARWSFEAIDPFISVLSLALQIPKYPLSNEWDLSEIT